MYCRRAIVVAGLILVGLVGCKSSNPPEADPTQSGASQSGASQSGAGQTSATQSEIPDDQTMAGPTDGGHFYVVVTPEPNPIAFQTLFSLTVEVFESADRKTPAAGVELDQVRATMPAHGHGMKTRPTIARVGDDPASFRVKGMKFHMQGDGVDGQWRIEVVLRDDNLIETAKFNVQCCRT